MIIILSFHEKNLFLCYHIASATSVFFNLLLSGKPFPHIKVKG